MRLVRNSLGWNIRDTTRAESFVSNKGEKQWKELALDATTKGIVGVYIETRNQESTLKLWHSLPPVYRGAGDAPPPVNVQFVIQIFGILIKESSQNNVIKL